MIKHIILGVLLLLVLASPVSGFADEHFPFLAVVSKESVNVRAGPNTNFAKIDKLNKSAQVVVLGRSYEWYKVQPLATTKEYIRSDYLRIKDGNAIGVVLGDNVNIRSSANSDAASLGEVKKGTVVRILEQAAGSGGGQKEGNFGWCRVQQVPGTAVWIHQDFLQEISGDVPPSLLTQVIQEPIAASIPEIPVKKAPSAVSPWISMRGTVEALVESPENGVHYEIVFEDKSFYFLQDMPNISFFCNTVVNVEGAIIPDPPKKLMYPLLHINKIALVL